jgi:Transglycosylase SLT domain
MHKVPCAALLLGLIGSPVLASAADVAQTNSHGSNSAEQDDKAAPAAPGDKAVPRTTAAPDVLCGALTASAQANGLPVTFFSNLIWQESRFDTDAVSHAGALGIAQFMPRTAAAVGLKDPFDPLQALPASARLLAKLYRRYGNLGLAAAAYNAGEKRVNDWLKGNALPKETRNYVLTITGLPIEQWSPSAPASSTLKLARKMPCRDVEAFAAATASEGATLGEASKSAAAAAQITTPVGTRKRQAAGSRRKATAMREHPLGRRGTGKSSKRVRVADLSAGSDHQAKAERSPAGKRLLARS